MQLASLEALEGSKDNVIDEESNRILGHTHVFGLYVSVSVIFILSIICTVIILIISSSSTSYSIIPY